LQVLPDPVHDHIPVQVQEANEAVEPSRHDVTGNGSLLLPQTDGPPPPPPLHCQLLFTQVQPLLGGFPVHPPPPPPPDGIQGPPLTPFPKI